MPMPAVAEEPVYTIYNHQWETAQRRIDRIASARIAREYRAVMEAIEEGWDILRPLAAAADREHRDLDLDDPTQAIAWVAHADVCDEFRGVAYECRDSIPTVEGFDGRPGIGNAVVRSQEIRAHLRVLRLATASCEFTGELRDLVVETDDAFRAWVDRLREIVGPVAEREERYLCENARPPRVRAT